LQKLEPLKDKPTTEFFSDAYLRDIVERNLEIAAQCCIDIGNKIISLEEAQKPQDCRESITRLGELGILPQDFALTFAPITGFRNILVHEYLGIDWDEVYSNLQKLGDFYDFVNFIVKWMKNREREAE